MLDWRERLVCSRCGSPQVDMMESGTKRRCGIRLENKRAPAFNPARALRCASFLVDLENTRTRLRWADERHSEQNKDVLSVK